MIAKEEQRVPNLRFKGFTDDWEQRKLGDFFKKYQNKIFLDDTTKYIQISVRNTGKVEYRTTNYGKDIGRKRQYLVDTKNYPDTLTFTRQTIYEGGIGYIPSSLNGAIVTENMPLLAKNSKIDKNFSKILFKTHLYYHNVIEKNKPIGSAQKALHEKVWLKSVVTVPTLLEQQKIGEFFKQLDSLITLHQRKLDHLEEQKKGFLQKMFPKKGQTVPEIRFPGFTDAWEQRKLSELIQKGGSGGTPKSTNTAYYNGNIPFLGISDISKSNGYIDDTEKYISEKGLDNSSAWIVPKGAISLAMYASVGKLAILNTDAATSQAFYNMVFEDVSIRDYVYHRLGKANEFGEWTRLISTGTQSNLNADKVKNFRIQIPQIIDEIKNISTFFNQLDSLIALHQRKQNHLKLLKKSLLQQMFM